MGWFGASIKRKEDADLLTGRGRYVDDIELPGMLHAAVRGCSRGIALMIPRRASTSIWKALSYITA